jgi:hypothetical protein
MRIGDVLYFSPALRFSDLDLDDSPRILEAFRDRIYGFYLHPAGHILEHGDAFAGGLICCAAVECITKFFSEEPIDWLCKHFPDLRENRPLADKFWIAFRHGLTHEGRVKSFGQFSLQTPSTFTLAEPALVVNPRRLLEQIREAFDGSCHDMAPGRVALLVNNVRRLFGPEIAAARL